MFGSANSFESYCVHMKSPRTYVHPDRQTDRQTEIFFYSFCLLKYTKHSSKGENFFFHSCDYNTFSFYILSMWWESKNNELSMSRRIPTGELKTKIVQPSGSTSLYISRGPLNPWSESFFSASYILCRGRQFLFFYPLNVSQLYCWLDKSSRFFLFFSCALIEGNTSCYQRSTGMSRFLFRCSQRHTGIETAVVQCYV